MIAGDAPRRWRWPPVKQPTMAAIDQVQHEREQDLHLVRLEIKDLQNQVELLKERT